MKFVSICFTLSVVFHQYSSELLDLDLNDLGCWKDTSTRSVPTLEGAKEHQHLQDNYGNREDPIKKCANAAYGKGYDVICIQNGGWCASSANARETYQKYGESINCKYDGEGGPWANHCYEIGKQLQATAIGLSFLCVILIAVIVILVFKLHEERINNHDRFSNEITTPSETTTTQMTNNELSSLDYKPDSAEMKENEAYVMS